jgi:hypothetical protein
MAIGTIVSLAGSANFPTTNELEVDMMPSRLNAFAGLTPFTKIMSRISKSNAKNFRIDLIEEHEIPTTVVVAQTESAVGTTVVMTEFATTLVKDTVLYNPRTDDLRIVDTTPTTQSVTVTISQGGTTSSSVWEQGDEIEVLFPALDEDDEDTIRDVSVANTNVYNLEQLVKLQFSITRVNNRMVTHFGGPGDFRMRMQQQKWNEFNIKGEKTRWFGGRASSGSGTSTKRMANGIVQILRGGTLFKDFNGVMTESAFDNYLGAYFDQNPDVTSVDYFVATNVARTISTWAKDKLETNTAKSAAYGMNVKTYITGDNVDVNLIPMPLFKSAETKGWGFLLDTSRVFLKYLDTPKLHKDAKDIGVSEKIIDTYREVSSILLANESRHSMHIGAVN